MKKIVFLASSFFSAFVFAGSQSGTVEEVVVSASNGAIYFKLNGAAANRPACATQEYWVIKDENSRAGQFQRTMVLSAQSAGKGLIIQGMNTCSRVAGLEDVNSIQLLLE